MDKTNLTIQTTYLATKDKTDDRFLYSGKIEHSSLSGGLIFYLFEVFGSESLALKFKRKITQLLGNASLSSDPDLLGTAFEDALVKINTVVENLSLDPKESLKKFNGIIGLLYPNDIMLAQTGNITGYIFRKGKISTITEKPGSFADLTSPSNSFVDITCGKLVEDDRIIIANSELYNHLSLDRLRRLAEGQPPKIALAELFKILRRSKHIAINAVIIAADDKATLGNQIVTDDLPDIIYLDEPEEKIWTALARKARPTIAAIKERSIQAHGDIKKHTATLRKTIAENWEKSVGPQSKKMIAQSKVMIGKGTGRISAKAQPFLQKATDKIKKDKYYEKIRVNVVPYAKVPSSAKISQKVKPAINGLAKLFLPNNRKYVYVVLFLVFLIIGYNKIKSNNDHRNEIKEQQTIASAYDQATEKYNKAKEDIALGKVSGNDKLIEALALAQKSQNDPDSKDKAVTLARTIQTSIDTSTKTTRIYDLAPLFAFTDTLQASTLIGTELYAATAEGKIYSADLREKEPKLLASLSSENGKVVSMAVPSGNDKIYLYTNAPKVFIFDIASKTVSEAKTEDDSAWESGKALNAFVSNLYILDSDKGELWKHTTRDTGFSKGSAYLDTRKIGIGGAVDFAIDGDIYVLQSDATILHFVRGAWDQSFSIKPIPAPGAKIEQPAKIFTDIDSNQLYVLDKKLNRIVRYSKGGDFVNQYSIDQVTIDNFVVNSKLQKMWVIAQGKIYEISL